MMRWIFLFAFSILFAKENVDFLFYLQDAGETHALLPVIEKLEARGHKVALLTAGVASDILRARDPWTFSDLGIKIDRDWERSRLLKEGEIARIALELEPRVVVTGVAFALQGQVLDFYRPQGIPTFAFWDNFNATGENPYFQTANSVAQKASDLLLPSEELHCHFKGKVVGHPSLEQWKERIELVDRQKIRKSLDISDYQDVALFIGGYGKEYEESFFLFLDCVEKVEEEFVFLIQPHPKFGGEWERKVIQEKNVPVRLLEGEVDTIEAVAASDLILCHQSTVAFQALGVGKPVFHLIPAHQVFDSILLQKGLAKRIHNSEEFLEILTQGILESEESLFEILGIPTQSASLCAEVLLQEVPHLQITPPSGLYDEALRIKATGLEPHQKFFIRSHLLTDRGEGWTAWALFEAAEKGEVDLAKVIPRAGTYRKADPMGLIWSMVPDSGKKTLFRWSGEKMLIEFTLELEGQITDRVQIERRNLEMDRIPVRERGVVGTLFLPPSDELLPGVITLSGSGGGLSESRAQALASHGFAVLALAYFGVEHLPKTLEEIPLEYFDEAIEWLKEHPAIDSEKIGLWGISRGAEAALLIGTTFPEKIQAIAAHVPSSALYSSSLTGGKPAWIYEGKPISPNAPFPIPEFSQEEGLTSEKAIALTPIFLEGMKDQEAFAVAAIPVEKIECPLLLVSGQDDQMWPSALFSEQIVQRLKEKDSSIPCSHLSYPGVGHHISPPHLPTTTSAELHPIAKLWLAFGGNPEDTSFARVDSWEKTVQFFEEHLRKK